MASGGIGAGSGDRFVHWVGEALAAVFYLFLIVSAVLPAEWFPVPRRLQVFTFVGLFLVLAIAPPYLKLLSDASASASSLASFVGKFPFHFWTLYYHPLLDRYVRRNWPGGLHYATIALDGESGPDEHLLLDNTIDPMNVSGFVLHLLPAILRSDDPERRRELVEFLFDFLEFKAVHHERHGVFNVSNRFLGPLSFPTANKHTEPDLEIGAEDLGAINIYHIPWPEDIGSLDLTEIDWSDLKGSAVFHVASYTWADSGTVIEERFRLEEGFRGSRN